MDSKQLEKFKTLLTEQLEQLQRQADIAAEELATENNQDIEYIDRASTHRDQDMRLKIKSRESRLITKIRLALERIENGTYGLCEVCEEPISIRRLEARPVTTKCIECKEQEEKIEAMTR